MTTNNPVVTITFEIEISDNRFLTERITPEDLADIAKRVLENDDAQNAINGAVNEVLERQYDLQRDQDDDGLSTAIVKFKALRGEDWETYEETVQVNNLAEAGDSTIYEWKQTLLFQDVRQTKVLEVKWAQR